jgi:hypothetical protein
VPITYPCIGLMTQAQGTTLKALVGGLPAVTMKSMIPMTTGDEAGSVGGVISGQIKGMALPKKGSAKVMMEGAPVMYATGLWSLNGASPNVPAMAQLLPSQVKLRVGP